jgi:hypothetical protein
MMIDLLIPETDKNLLKFIKMFYEMLGLQFTGWIRKAKMILLLDDLSGTGLFQNITSNDFYKMLTR